MAAEPEQRSRKSSRPLKGRKAVQKMYNDLMTTNKVEGVSVELVNDKIYNWMATLTGPPDTPYEGGKYHVSCNFTTHFPGKAPKCKMETKIIHININGKGHICIPSMSEDGEFKDGFTMSEFFEEVMDILNEPSVHDVINFSAAELYSDPKKFYKFARITSIKHANAPRQLPNEKDPIDENIDDIQDLEDRKDDDENDGNEDDGGNDDADDDAGNDDADEAKE